MGDKSPWRWAVVCFISKHVSRELIGSRVEDSDWRSIMECRWPFFSRTLFLAPSPVAYPKEVSAARGFGCSLVRNNIFYMLVFSHATEYNYPIQLFKSLRCLKEFVRTFII